MRFLLFTAMLSCKRAIRRPGTLVIAIMIPLVCAAAGLYLSAGGDLVQIRVGIAVEEGDAFGEEIYRALIASDSPIAFSRHTWADIPYLESEVAGGRMEAAYLISPELGDRISRGRAFGGVTLIRSPRTALDILAGEVVSAAILRAAGPGMSIELLVEVLELEPGRASELAGQLAAHYHAHPEIFLEPVFVYTQAAGSSQPLPAFGGRILHGLIALFLLAGVIWSLPGQIREAPGILRRLPPRPARAFVWGRGLGTAASGMIGGLLGLAALALIYPAALSGLAVQILVMIGYLFALSMIGSALALLCRRPDIIYASGGLVLILTAALGGVFIDLGEINPGLGRVSDLFPSSHYLAGMMGGGLDALFPLFGFGLAGWLISGYLAGRVK